MRRGSKGGYPFRSRLGFMSVADIIMVSGHATSVSFEIQHGCWFPLGPGVGRQHRRCRCRRLGCRSGTGRASCRDHASPGCRMGRRRRVGQADVRYRTRFRTHFIAVSAVKMEPALPSNLYPPALRDLVRILRESRRQFGTIVARQSRDRLYARCEAIRTGNEKGHLRADVQPRYPTRFADETPWVIAFDPETRNIYRIVHGHRHLPSMFTRSRSK